MIELHTLGVLELRGPDGAEVGSVLHQPKRLGLLAYLAVASPRRFHRRDSLLALFWPELDQDHARAALRRSLYFLRSALGAEVLIGRGDEEVGVSAEALWCDATALDEAMAADRPEEALALYRGTLLDGLFVAGASAEFQDWLDRERGRLRNRATAAADALAVAAETDGRLTDAIGWARRALELNPGDEGALRRSVTLLERIGDRPAALRAYEEFARRLEQELALEPSPETRKLVDSIRARAATPRASAAPAPPPAPSPMGDATTIAVLPFAVRGDPRLAYLGEGMVDLLATKIDGAGSLRAVDPRALLHFLGRVGEAGAGPPEGRVVAEHFGAGRYLVGSLVEAGGRLRANATLYSAAGGTVASVEGAAESEAQLFELVDQLARDLLAAEGVAPGTRLTRLAALTTDSLDALKAYLQGERELRAGRYFDAMEGFQAAVDADPSFALAYYRLAAAAAGCALPDLARELADRGFEHRQRLSAHDQLVFNAQRAWLHGIVPEAESLYSTITATWPDDVEAWFHLGDLLFHSNPLRGRSAAEAREPFERVVRLEPDHVGTLAHLTRIAAIERRTGEMLDLIGRLLRLSPGGDQALAFRALRAFTTGDRAEADRVVAELQRARAITVAIAFSDVALYSGDLDGAELLARSFIQVARSPELRALCHILLAHLAVARERKETAEAELGQAEALDPVWGVEIRALFVGLGLLPAGEAEALRLRDALERWDPQGAPASSFPVFALHNDLHPGIRLHLLGLLAIRQGALAAAAEWLDRLERMAQPPEAPARSLAVELRARLLRAEGRDGEALALLDGSRPELWFQLTVASPFFSLASRRFLHAELLEQAGRGEEARGWYATIAERSPYELIYAAPARRRLEAMAGSVSR